MKKLIYLFLCIAYMAIFTSCNKSSESTGVNVIDYTAKFVIETIICIDEIGSSTLNVIVEKCHLVLDFVDDIVKSDSGEEVLETLLFYIEDYGYLMLDYAEEVFDICLDYLETLYDLIVFYFI